jgi:hypothetical protein
MFAGKSTNPDEVNISLGAHGVELIPCHDTPQLAELTTVYLEVKSAIEKLQSAKSKVGLLRGKLSRENQQRSTASETSVFGVEAVNRLYAFTAARAEFELEILHVEAARTKLGELLTKILIRKDPHELPARWMVSDIKEGATHALVVVARHNVASAIAVLNSLRDKLPKYREYCFQLPEFVNVLWNSFCAQGGTREYEEVWQSVVYGDKPAK